MASKNLCQKKVQSYIMWTSSFEWLYHQISNKFYHIKLKITNLRSANFLIQFENLIIVNFMHRFFAMQKKRQKWNFWRCSKLNHLAFLKFWYVLEIPIMSLMRSEIFIFYNFHNFLCYHRLKLCLVRF